MSIRDAHNRFRSKAASGESRQTFGCRDAASRAVGGEKISGAGDSGAAIPGVLLRHHGERRREPGEPFAWAAEIGGHRVGLLGLAPGENGTVRIRCFRLEPQWRHTSIAGNLIRHLYEHCDAEGYLRVVAEASLAPGWFWRMFPRHGFRLHARQRGPRCEELQFVLVLRHQA